MLNEVIKEQEIVFENEVLGEEKEEGKEGGMFSYPRFLVFADTHDALSYSSLSPSILSSFANEQYDLCLLLGDIPPRDLREILQYVPKEKMIGILGNHDDKNTLSMFGIENINAIITHKCGMDFLGLEGCIKYKQSQPGYTLGEAHQMLSSQPKCDVLLSHTIPYEFMGKLDPVHIGNPAINDYLLRTNTPLVICGHNHTYQEGYLENGTQILEVFGICVIDITPEGAIITRKEESLFS